MNDSRISGLHKLTITERIDKLEHAGFLSAADATALRNGQQVLSLASADNMIENVIGRFALPLAVAPNFRVNERDYIVPLAVEEPSIVAALSSSARLARESGGFAASLEESLLIGQVHLASLSNVQKAQQKIAAQKGQLLETANAVHPRLSARGGGVRDIEAHEIRLGDGSSVLAVHLLVDTCDAMGANLVNTICEALAPVLVELCGGDAALRILSNLVDRSVVTAAATYRLDDLGAEARDAIVLASEIAKADVYRAATHNKGIMNGIDAVAVATGNDWRAIEAGAHAFAASGASYSPLATWSVDGDGNLRGEIEIALKVGAVGGTLTVNPAAAAALSICAVDSAAELAMLMAAVGLAQNFAAMRALATTGIQAGHMRLRARSLAAAAGAAEYEIADVVNELVASGDVKDWKAREIVRTRRGIAMSADAASGAGKVILLGEHAAVYGKHALALPIVDAVTAIAARSVKSSVSISEWGLHESLPSDSPMGRAVLLIARELQIDAEGVELRISSRLPRAMGLGSSAAIAVAITRALANLATLEIDLERVNAIAFECEKLAHGTPSGVDNTVASYATPMLFRRGEIEESIELAEPVPIVIACSNSTGNTIEQVAGVRERREQLPARYDAIFAEIDAASVAGADALQRGDYSRLGLLMNVCQGLLNAIGVSTPDLEAMLAIARASGAAGAKLTGAGGGGSIVALCPGRETEVRHALRRGGYRTVSIGGAEDAL